MLKTLRNRLSKLESQKPTTEYRYQLNAIIIMDDTASDDEIMAKQLKNPDRKYIRWGDFVDECC